MPGPDAAVDIEQQSCRVEPEHGAARDALPAGFSTAQSLHKGAGDLRAI